MQTHRQLRVWQQSIELAKQVHFLCARYPREELFALTSQMNRAAVSIASNIAEILQRNSIVSSLLRKVLPLNLKRNSS